LLEAGVLLVFAAGGLLTGLAWRQRSALARAWLAAAESCRLEEVRVRRRAGRVRRLEARRGGLDVRLEFARGADMTHLGTRILVGGLTRQIQMRLEEPPEPLTYRPPRGNVPVGDEVFDETMSVKGSRRHALALLDAKTRSRTREVFAGRRHVVGLWAEVSLPSAASVTGGRLVVERFVEYRPEVFSNALADVLALAEALVEPDALEPRLARNAREDPEPQVRLANLRELVAESPRHAATREALRAAAADGDELVQLEAAVHLGSEGKATLLDIASRGWSADACCARAVAELRSALPVEQARAILAHALRTRRLETAQACVDSLSRRGGEDVDAFARVLALEQGPLAEAAARALGRVGSVSSVPTLLDAQRRLAGDEDVRQAVREAVAAIQSRASGALPGQLSLAGEQSGQVSLARDERGRVSLDGDDPPD
jgi:hypothetical protein